MASLTIRNLDERTKTHLRTAIESTQAEVRVERLGTRIHAHFDALGGVELELPERGLARSAGARLGQQP